MNTTNITLNKFLKTQILVILLLFFYDSVLGQQTPPKQPDSTKTTFSFRNLKLPNPNSVVTKYTYDPITNRYIYTERVGSFNIKYPLILTPKEYQKLVDAENLKNYYKEKIDAFEGKKEGADELRKNLIPDFYVNSDFFSSIFGSDTISIAPQGSVELDLGVLFTKQDNPSFSPRNRSNFTFDFDQRINLSLLGQVGTRLQVTANFDTEATFNFQNLVKLEYTPTEDDIVKKIEVGNVSLPLNSSLITGAQSLFGVKTELQFGKTTITGIFSEQRSETRSVVAQGGGRLQEFEFFGLDYDENRHFFLAQYFRDNYDEALLTYPYINSPIQITRIEVWVTNRGNRTDNIRNIVAIEDLGEADPSASKVSIPFDNLDQPQPGFPFGTFFNVGPNTPPDNGNNDLDPTAIGTTSVLNENIRNISNVQSGFGSVSQFVNEGFEYSRLENARQLTQANREFTLNTQLGYISLNQRLQNDEVLAVAYQYTIGGQVFQVGEFANDGVDATGVSTDTNTGNQVIDNNALVLKTLKSSITSVEEPFWNLMMKNIYDTGAFRLSQEDFSLNIFYTETSPLNFITPVEGTTFPIFDNNTPDTSDDGLIQETPLIRLFNLDKLNFNGDPQGRGDGFFDFVPGITVITENGKLIFTNIEPFGRYLFDVLDDDNNPNNNEVDYATSDRSGFNPNQALYVYDRLYQETKTAALEDGERNKFQIKGRYKSEGGGGIPIGSFNVPRGSVTVTAGGRVLVEGIDYTVDYIGGTVQIIDPALQASNVPIQISTEDNAVFGQQTKRFAGFNIEHQFNENFVLGGTFINLSERPITQKANFNSEPINNTIFGINGNFSTELPFLTRLVNKLPNIDTDVPSQLSARGEFAYLLPGSPKGIDFEGESTSFVDDFEGTQNGIDLLSPLAWTLSSRPRELGRIYAEGGEDENGVQNGFDRGHLNWYSVDPIFYSNQRPSGISDDDVSDLFTRRVFIDELFPQVDIAQGQTTVINTLDLAFYPGERGAYNMDPAATNDILNNPTDSWAGITRQLTSTNFEQSNVEFIEFWVQDPFLNNPNGAGGKLTFNLGNISEDILKDGRKQYENGLPENGDISGLVPTDWGSVVPQEQSLVYAFATEGQERANQDVGFDGYDDVEEATVFPAFSGLEDPTNDNYVFFLNRDGNIFERYRDFNGLEGNTPDQFSNEDRGSTTQPDVEDVNRDNTLNTIDSYFEYEVDITPTALADENNELINDRRLNVPVTLPNGNQATVNWYQFRIPLTSATRAIGGITDFRSIRFIRMYLNEFSENTVLRFGTLDLVRSDWRRYNLALDDEPNNDDDNTIFTVSNIGIQENDGRYVSPPGVEREELNNNNNIIRQNEESLVVEVCDLETRDSRAVFKNINVDMRRYKRLRMFLHAENGSKGTINDGEAIGFIRMGNDFTENFYQIEVPLQVTNGNSNIPEVVWPDVNEIDLPIEILAQIKALGISNGTLGNEDPTFYDVVDDVLIDNPVSEFSPYTEGQQRVAIKGNPSFGDIRTLMLGIKNADPENLDICTEVWYNELRLSEIDNEGGWAAVATVDANIADFLTINATGRRSTTGFGSIEQGPNERSREDVQQYDFVTNVRLGQLLPKKWGLNIPFNYAQSEALITPEYDQRFKDIRLDDRLRAAQTSEERETIREQSEDYTKRKSINLIGVTKNRTGDKTPRFYDVENLTLNYSFNETEHRDFEIENALDQNVRVGGNYNFNFNPIKIAPFKEKDSLFTGEYWQLLKDFNFNLLPTSLSVNSDFSRQFNRQRFREIDLGAGNIGVDELFRRNYLFDFQYTVNWDISDNLRANFSATNNNIVRNYFIDDNLSGEQDPTLDVWDSFFDIGDPNRRAQQLGINYQIPLDKIPVFDFVNATYAYTGDFLWQKGSDLFGNIEIDGENFDLGNTISNNNTHNITAALDLKKLYKRLGLVKRTSRQSNVARGPVPPGPNAGNQKTKPKTSKLFNTAVDILTSVKRLQISYQERNGTFLPGFLETPGFLGTSKPSLGFTFGGQRDIRNLAARNGFLTTFQDFNQQFTQTEIKDLNFSGVVELSRDLKIDINGGRSYASNFTENFNTIDIDNDGRSDQFNSLIQNTFGNFNISTVLIKTAFNKSDENGSKTFDDFRANRLPIARRLAQNAGINLSDPANFENGDVNNFPLGFGRTNQAVLLPAFLSAYSGRDPEKVKLGAFRDIPIPNWNLKYSGFTKLKWFKKNFKRFSITHGYNSTYTINQFRSNLDFEARNPNLDFASQPANAIDQAGNFKNETLFSNINLTESFSPLIRIDLELKNSLKVLAEIRKDRLLSLSFDNNLLTEVQTDEFTLGLGYRIKDVRIRSQYANNASKIIKSDLNMKADISIRDNKTIIRFLDLENNQVTTGQTIWSLKYSADYAFSKNLTGIFFFDYQFSEFAISTAFPQTTVRSGVTLRYNFGN
ncbi:cell surface protein SprA [Flavobacteriaceae bacterium AU392]|nr:cell surface protein SprA [Flavobacteriaceae bacterium]RKM81644.1 cell surface protein SprA [Flavobacteriaceae bacterium AU392]